MPIIQIRLALFALLTVACVAPWASAADKKPADKKPADAKKPEPGKPGQKKVPILEQQPHPLRDPVPVAAAIDRALEARLREAGIPASPEADDAEFLRRACLDLTGCIPTRERALAFLENTDPDKRRKLIDELLAGPEYGRHLATVWRDRLAPRDISNTKAQADRFGPWLAEQLQRNRGWDRLAFELLTAEGDANQLPQTAFVMANGEGRQPQPGLLAAATGQVFLGVQLQCAECHDHPFAPWKQEDFWGVAAFFGRTRNSGVKGPPFLVTEMPDPKPVAVRNGGVERPEVRPGGAIVVPSAGGNKGAGKVVAAKWPGGEPLQLDEAVSWRPRFAAWVTSGDNPYFARAFVNRTWAQLFNRGLVQPVDNQHDDNPPSHPELLTLLAQELVASEFDVKHLFRCLCNSAAYRRTSRPLAGNEKDVELFSHMSVKPIGAEALYDSVVLVLGDSKSSSPAAKGSGKSMPVNPRDEFISFFRGTGNAESTELSHGIPQFLRRMNGEVFNGGAALIGKLGTADASREGIIEALYLTTLARRPSAEEGTLMAEYVARRPSAAEGYAGVLWILLNSGEFVLNR